MYARNTPARVAAEAAREESEAKADREAEAAQADTIRDKARDLITDAAWVRDNCVGCFEIDDDSEVDADASGGAWVTVRFWVPDEGK